MSFRIVTPDQLEWITRPHEPREPARHVAELYERAAAPDVPANIWRYEPGAKGRRHRHRTQTEVFVVLAGTLSMYLGDPAERHDVPTGGVVVVEPGTALQSANHGDVDLVVYAYGTPPEHERAELLDGGRIR
jgi:mannose-6-phosphate isomerase-like protein (cupin superfamily)